MKPLVSCIITTYKRPLKTLKRAIDSILNQTYDNIEVILVNDYPDNKTLVKEIETFLTSLENRNISHIVHEKNLGACAARNTGITASKGEFIAFLDDDDEWLPTKIEKQLSLMIDDEIGLVYCQYFRMEKNHIIKISPRDLCENATKEIYTYNFIGGNSFPLLRKKAVLDAGLFDENLQSSQDTDMWIRIIENDYKIRYLKEPLVNYYVSDEAISTNVDKIKSGYTYLLNKYSHIYENDLNLHIRKLNMIGVALFVHGSKSEGLRYWKKAMGIKLNNINNLLFIKKMCGYILMEMKKR
ncbi:glycosyltransferase family 2 protein [Priestia megaterium]|uniref:glycosyltransferase family 2 protein n=1 Tax=Priestia megaterium TaxID=1404 RepID=UPI0034D7A419